MDEAALESALRRLVEHAGPFARDSTLSPPQLEGFQVGRVLREPTFCDASYRVAGLVAPHRFLIISAEARALPESGEPDNPRRGLCIWRPDSYFKVIDRTAAGEKLQVALLQIPDELFPYFRAPELGRIEQKFAELARECFAECLDEPAIPELDSDGWRDRLMYPVGLDDDGRPWPLSCEAKPLPEDDGGQLPIRPGDVVTFDTGLRHGDIVAFDRVGEDQIVVRVCEPLGGEPAGPRFRAARGEKPGTFTFEPLP